MRGSFTPGYRRAPLPLFLGVFCPARNSARFRASVSGLFSYWKNLRATLPQPLGVETAGFSLLWSRRLGCVLKESTHLRRCVFSRGRFFFCLLSSPKSLFAKGFSRSLRQRLLWGSYFVVCCFAIPFVAKTASGELSAFLGVGLGPIFRLEKSASVVPLVDGT